jgi:putative ABC transport system permease protein
MVDWMESVLNPDLFVMPTQSLDVRAARFPASMRAELEAVPGVDRVQVLRNARASFRGAPALIAVTEMAALADTVNLPAVAGRVPDMYVRAAAGEGVVLSDNFAQRQGLGFGDRVEIAAPYGVITLPVVGIIVDYSEQHGAIWMDRSVFIRYWHDDSVNVFRVYTRPGTPPLTVRQQIIDRLGGERQMFVSTNAELKAYITGLLDQWSGLTTLQIAVALLVAVLGIVTTLTVSINDRRRELGILRVVGALHAQVRRTIWIEAISIGVFGLILGVALGAVNLVYVLQMVQRDVTGFRLAYDFPVVTAAILVPVIGVVALIAALWPAEAALRSSLVEALEYE